MHEETPKQSQQIDHSVHNSYYLFKTCNFLLCSSVPRVCSLFLQSTEECEIWRLAANPLTTTNCCDLPLCGDLLFAPRRLTHCARKTSRVKRRCCTQPARLSRERFRSSLKLCRRTRYYAGGEHTTPAMYNIVPGSAQISTMALHIPSLEWRFSSPYSFRCRPCIS